MARYIKEYEVYEKLKISFHMDPIDVEEFLGEIPKADVVPKSEVEEAEKEIDRLKEILTNYALQYGTVKTQQKVIAEAKQEVAREIFEEIRKEIELALDSNYKARHANGYGEFGEYVNGKIHALRGIDDFIAEFKKKYIGE